MAYTRLNPNALVLLIAAVSPNGADFLIEFAACCLIDRFGVIYESEWEFLAGAQLQEANCGFVKPASTLYRVAPVAAVDLTLSSLIAPGGNLSSK